MYFSKNLDKNKNIIANKTSKIGVACGTPKFHITTKKNQAIKVLLIFINY
jgi:hypothetical protein